MTKLSTSEPPKLCNFAPNKTHVLETLIVFSASADVQHDGRKIHHVWVDNLDKHAIDVLTSRQPPLFDLLVTLLVFTKVKDYIDGVLRGARHPSTFFWNVRSLLVLGLGRRAILESWFRTGENPKTSCRSRQVVHLWDVCISGEAVADKRKKLFSLHMVG